MCGEAIHAEYEKQQPKRKTTAELKTVLLTICDNLPQQSIDKAVLSLERGCRHVLEIAADILSMSSYKTMLKQFNKRLFL